MYISHLVVFLTGKLPSYLNFWLIFLFSFVFLLILLFLNYDRMDLYLLVVRTEMLLHGTQLVGRLRIALRMHIQHV